MAVEPQWTIKELATWARAHISGEAEDPSEEAMALGILELLRWRNEAMVVLEETGQHPAKRLGETTKHALDRLLRITEAMK